MDENSVIYLDYNATTYIHEQVAAEMLPFLTTHFGNPSSTHVFGNRTKLAVQNAREQVARMLNSQSSEIVFTSGGSESNNYAIKGSVLQMLQHPNYQTQKLQIMTSQIEHPSVLEVFKHLEKQLTGRIEVVYLPVTSTGVIDVSYFKAAIKPSIGFISVMHANNETGVTQPITELVELAKNINKSVIFHTDAAQSIGKTVVDVESLKVDLLTVCPHKFYGPKGIGALYIRTGVETRLEKLIHGANHEKNMRAGTENVLEIVGLGKASELVHKELQSRMDLFQTNRDLIYNTLASSLGEKAFILQGPPLNEKNRLSNTLFISFPGLEANLIMDMLAEKLACSAGAACHSEEVKMSHVLEAMKVRPEDAMGTIRLSTGLGLKKEEALRAGELIAVTVKKLREQWDNKAHGELIVQKVENKEEPLTKTDQKLWAYSSNNGDPLLEEIEPFEILSEVKLTKTTHGLGCGCKLSAVTLSTILSGLGKQKLLLNNKNILVGTETSDDCCVYKVTEEHAIVSTLDFFTPICDDPESFGAIACANALSDIYAMGGTPLFALNIVGFPIKTMTPQILQRILKGAQEKAEEAGVAILGGHSIEDTEPKFGLSVTGIINPGAIWTNCGMLKGDYILVTKKLGVGTMMTALKRGLLSEKDAEYKEAVDSMKRLNKGACEVLLALEQKNKERIVSACTDITGFGLLGHLKEGLMATKKSASVFFESVSFISNTRKMIEMGVISGGVLNNIKFVEECCEYDERLSKTEKNMINDPQTSGGLMIFLAEKWVKTVLAAFELNGLERTVIGRVEKEETGKIYVRKEHFKDEKGIHE